MANKTRKTLSVVVGPLVFLLMELIGKPETLGTGAYHVLSVAAWMSLWWVTEAVPISVTALLPIILFPLTGALSIAETTESFGHKYIFLYMGGFMLAIAIENWGLHKRIALNIINVIGSNVTNIILGFMVATAFLSMWISNTATSVMMLPIGTAIVSQFKKSPKGDDLVENAFGKALMLSIAYSASIGGFATLIGTPPNLVLAGILQQIYEVKISFFQWMIFGLPTSLLLLFICWWYLTRVAFSFDQVSFPGGKSEVKKMLLDLGEIRFEEKIILGVFVATACAWMFRSLLEKMIPGLDDTIIAMVAAVALFLIPNMDNSRKIINWDEAVKLPWGIILLFGGGMALAKGFTTTGLAEWIAGNMSQLDGLSVLILILVLVTMVNFLTEITSNLATTAMLLPVLAPMAVSFDLHPYMIMVSVTLAASCAFMLPVATPPNAVVFGSGYLRIPDMMKAGVLMNVLSILVITLATYFILPYLWDIDPNQFPDIFRNHLKLSN